MLSFRVSVGLITFLLAALLYPQAVVQADEDTGPPVKVDVLQKGSSSAKSIEQALADLPTQGLTAEQKARVDQILKNRSLFRRLPTIGMDADPAVYDYFTRNPESAVGIWRALDISQFRMSPIGNNLWKGDAGDGSQGTIEVLHRTATSQLLLCEGEYKCPVLPKPIKAQAVMHLRTRFNEPNKHAVSHDLDLFVAFPSQTVETVARVIAPVSNSIADRNFRELSLFVQFMTVTMRKQPGWVEQVAQKMDGVRRDQKEELLKLSAQVFVTARRSELEKDGVRTASLEEILAPYQPGKK